mmetsp:Transcript_94162/g.293307  ORF Transcript_94162/g.293307 Transcript_94162/m.293307 type:complete len:249 (-) Transcript_94162:302-1048(-)
MQRLRLRPRRGGHEPVLHLGGPAAQPLPLLSDRIFFERVAHEHERPQAGLRAEQQQRQGRPGPAPAVLKVVRLLEGKGAVRSAEHGRYAAHALRPSAGYLGQVGDRGGPQEHTQRDDRGRHEEASRRHLPHLGEVDRVPVDEDRDDPRHEQQVCEDEGAEYDDAAPVDEVHGGAGLRVHAARHGHGVVERALAVELDDLLADVVLNWVTLAANDLHVQLEDVRRYEHRPYAEADQLRGVPGGAEERQR